MFLLTYLVTWSCYYRYHRGTVVTSVCLGICLVSVCEQDYAKNFQAIVMQPCRIMNFCCGKNLLNVGFVLAQNGQMSAILDFCCHKLQITFFHQHLLGGAFRLHCSVITTHECSIVMHFVASVCLCVFVCTICNMNVDYLHLVEHGQIYALLCALYLYLWQT